MTENSAPNKLPTSAYALTVRVRLENKPGRLSRVVQIIAEHEASLDELSLLHSDFHYKTREITIKCRDEEHMQDVKKSLQSMECVALLSDRDDVLHYHKGGKISVESRLDIKTSDDLAQVYSPGVARICTLIHEDEEKAYDYTIRGTCVGIVTDGSAVLGLGNIGPKAAMPVMEGKAMLFKGFADVEAFPICLDTQDTDQIVRTIEVISPGFAGINLEDISAPRCFEIEERLSESLDIPVFHDDQHGTACVVLAGLSNALRIVDKKPTDVKVVISGFGAGGVACTRMLLAAGFRDIVPCDSAGIVYRGRPERMNPVKNELLEVTNLNNEQGSLADALRGADVFVGVSKPGTVTPDMVKSMNRDPIVFALANPDPEILPGHLDGIARIVATGRSDYANQVNNVLCFPGLFRGALSCRASRVTDKMKIEAAYAIASAIGDDELREDYIIPDPFDQRVPELVAERVREAAIDDGVAQQ